MDLWEALNLLNDMGIHFVDVELNCKLVFDTLGGRQTVLNLRILLYNVGRPVYYKILKLVLLRDNNRVAYSLTRMSRSYASRQLHDLISICIVDLLWNEMS